MKRRKALRGMSRVHLRGSTLPLSRCYPRPDATRRKHGAAGRGRGTPHALVFDLAETVSQSHGSCHSSPCDPSRATEQGNCVLENLAHRDRDHAVDGEEDMVLWVDGEEPRRDEVHKCPAFTMEHVESWSSSDNDDEDCRTACSVLAQDMLALTARLERVRRRQSCALTVNCQAYTPQVGSVKCVYRGCNTRTTCHPRTMSIAALRALRSTPADDLLTSTQHECSNAVL